MSKLVEGKSYESKSGIKFEIVNIDHIEKEAMIKFQNSGLCSAINLSDIEKSLEGEE